MLNWKHWILCIVVCIATDANAEDVLAQLLEDDIEDEPLSIAAVDMADSPVDLPADRLPLAIEGSPLIARPARLVSHGNWWTLVFESDDPDHPEPPIRVLPNKNLEVMVRGTELGGAGVVFIVSGVVTLFEHENYVLVRTARRRIDSGNFRK